MYDIILYMRSQPTARAAEVENRVKSSGIDYHGRRRTVDGRRVSGGRMRRVTRRRAAGEFGTFHLIPSCIRIYICIIHLSTVRFTEWEAVVNVSLSAKMGRTTERQRTRIHTYYIKTLSFGLYGRMYYNIRVCVLW